MGRLEDKVSELLEKLDFLQHQLEHQLAAVDDHTKVRTAGAVLRAFVLGLALTSQVVDLRHSWRRLCRRHGAARPVAGQPTQKPHTRAIPVLPRISAYSSLTIGTDF